MNCEQLETLTWIITGKPVFQYANSGKPILRTLFIEAKVQKQPKCPSTGDLLKLNWIIQLCDNWNLLYFSAECLANNISIIGIFEEMNENILEWYMDLWMNEENSKA